MKWGEGENWRRENRKQEKGKLGNRRQEIGDGKPACATLRRVNRRPSWLLYARSLLSALG